MKYSLLDMTQTILSALNSDEVNSIFDTTEARQVAEIIRTCYYNILARSNIPEHQELIQLLGSGDLDVPVLMRKPEGVTRVHWIKYNKSEDDSVLTDPVYEYVTILPLEQFLDKVHRFDPTQANVGKFTLDDHVFYFEDDRHPSFCTLVSDYNFVFDTYNSAFDGTLQETKTLCSAEVAPVFEMTDDFTPDLDDIQFPLLLNEAKSLAFFELKQVPHTKAEQESRRQWVSLQRTKNLNKESDFDKLPNFGRKR